MGVMNEENKIQRMRSMRKTTVKTFTKWLPPICFAIVAAIGAAFLITFAFIVEASK
jgi:hypothetical protein